MLDIGCSMLDVRWPSSDFDALLCLAECTSLRGNNTQVLNQPALCRSKLKLTSCRLLIPLACFGRRKIIAIEDRAACLAMTCTPRDTAKYQILKTAIEHPVSSIQHRASNIQHRASSIQYPVSSIQYPASNIQHHSGFSRNRATVLINTDINAFAFIYSHSL
jgi:hypothetical protein